jgi:hypothetical protein
MTEEIVTTKPGSPLVTGLRLVFSNWRCLTWTYALGLLLGLLATLPVFAQYSSLLDHSLEAARIAGKFDVADYQNAGSLLSERTNGAMTGSIALDVLFALVFFIFTPAILSIYLGDELASLGTMFRTGLRFFWRMVRLTLIFAILAGIIIGILSAVRGGLLSRLDAKGVIERPLFFWSLGTGLFIACVGFFFRLWLDVAQVVVVERGTYRIGRVENRSAWKALGPAWRLMLQGFYPLYFSFVLIGVLSWIGFLAPVALWHAGPSRATHWAFLCGQIALFLLLAGRFWQRGVVAAWFNKYAAAITPVVIPMKPPVVDHHLVEEPIEGDDLAETA